MCLRVLRDALVSRATASERALVRATVRVDTCGYVKSLLMFHRGVWNQVCSHVCPFVVKLRHKLLSSNTMKLLHYVSQAPHTNINNWIIHKDLQNAAISLNESNSWRRLTTKEHTWLLTGDTRKIFVSNIKTVDESHSARVLIGCKPINMAANLISAPPPVSRSSYGHFLLDTLGTPNTPFWTYFWP